jgi:hypothetical protein
MIENSSQINSAIFAQKYLLPSEQKQGEEYYKVLQDILNGREFPNKSDTLPEELLNHLRKPPQVETLIKLAEYDKKVAQLCENEALEVLWDKAMTMMGRHPTFKEAKSDPNLTYHRLVPFTGLASFNWIRGTVFYDKAGICFKENKLKAALDFLEKAESYQSFEAISALSMLDYERLQQKEEFSDQQLNAMMERIEKVITPYGTPAFLLLASISLSIANYYERNANYEQERTFLQSMFKCLYAAEFSKEYSKTAIDNVYYGKNIAYIKEFDEGLNINQLSWFIEDQAMKFQVSKDDMFIVLNQGKEAARRYNNWAASHQSENLDTHARLELSS